MLTVTKTSSNRIDIELDGELNSEKMRTALDELIEASSDVEHGLMLYRITNFEMPTVGAIAVELSRLPKLFGLLGKFDRCAVLSDSAWIRTTAEIEGAVFPGIKIKSFELKDAEAAESWLSE